MGAALCPALYFKKINDKKRLRVQREKLSFCTIMVVLGGTVQSLLSHLTHTVQVSRF